MTTMKKKGLRKLTAMVLLTAMILSLLPNVTLFSQSRVRADVGDIPAHNKRIKDNEDGTYTLSLDVTGDSVKNPQKINVIVIVDRSGSMDDGAGTGTYVATNSTGNGLYGLIDGEYVPLERRGTQGNRTFWYNGVQYTGQRYRYDSSATRLEATKSAINGLASSLLSYNGKDGNPADTVQMALVSFATTAQTNVSGTTEVGTYATAVNGLDADGGTNWEAALKEANTVSFGDNDPTFVIFFSDGSPTFYGGSNVHGSGYEEEPNMDFI